MSKEYLEVNLQTINDKVKFSAKARSNPEVVIDYFPHFSFQSQCLNFAPVVNCALVIRMKNALIRNMSFQF